MSRTGGAVSVWSKLRELFTLREAERAVARFSRADRAEIRREIEDAVESMQEASQSGSRLVRSRLARQAVVKVLVATAAARQLGAEPREADWPDLEQAIRLLSPLPELAEHQSLIETIAGEDALTDAEYRRLADLFARVERLTDLRTPRDLLVSRWARRLGVATALLAGGWFATRPANLARGRMVTSSTVCGDNPVAPLGKHRLARLVDGVRRENSFATCTDTESHPWVTIDLGAPHSIQRVVVYPHSDGPWGKKDVPAEIRVSLDNEHFETVGRRDALYTVDFPWSLQLPKVRAQYVQVIGVKGQQRFVLNEVEVYGR